MDFSEKALPLKNYNKVRDKYSFLPMINLDNLKYKERIIILKEAFSILSIDQILNYYKNNYNNNCLEDFLIVPFSLVIAEKKISIEEKMDTLKILTKIFSVEFALNQLMLTDSEKILNILEKWAEDIHPNVRRAASEGCRVSLPWGKKLSISFDLIKPILDKLKNDTSIFVMKSVSNNLNDWSKREPEKVLLFSQQLPEKWKKQALRTLIKQGHPLAINSFVNSSSKANIINIKNSSIVKIGEKFNFSFDLITDQPCLVDFVIYFKKKHKTNKKVFKLGKYDESKSIVKSFQFKNYSTRTLLKGEHFFSLLVNGRETEKISFMVED